jgi:glycosyltransferase involved in cell wall biosynthesis
MSMPETMQLRIVIGIPTFRRPDLLRILLDSLLPEIQGRDVYVVVADNDCGTEAQAVVAEFTQHWPVAECIPVRERGVAQVRNALVRRAAEVCPEWDWLLMLDDDGRVTPGWLDQVLQTGQRFDAHLVGGPVDGLLPDSASIFARNSIFASRKRWPTGLVSTLNTTQNLAMARKTVDLIGIPLFRNEYGASGGEDYDLFRRVARAKGRIAWCDEALVIEPAPSDRLTFISLLRRYATTGAYMVRIDRFYDGLPSTSWNACKGLAVSLLRTVAAAVLMRRDTCARSILVTAHYCGRIAGLAGARTARYVSSEGKNS